MTITMTAQEEEELWDEVAQSVICDAISEPFEFTLDVPKQLGKGSSRAVQVHPEIWLAIMDYEYHNDVIIQISEWEHPLQFGVLLSGSVIDEYGGKVGEGYTCISGSGIQRQMSIKIPQPRRVGVDIHMSPDVLRTFFPTTDGEILPQLRFLAKGDDWQTLVYPEITPTIQGVVQQIINCPYHGVTKRMYLQAKVLELMTLQLTPILAHQEGLQPLPRLKSGTIARIHHAREILHSNLENPPLLLELAQMVGISDRTLRRGFQELFGTTVFRYLTDKRMEWAEQLLRQGNTTVGEVAHQVGYSEQGRFASAFKRRFGIMPSECLSGKKSVSD
ncbi:helix-turn-helix transcriptional regulator [Nostoc sp. 'Lobaria pulmonaria (5183) cyanobiont']|uniref:helix-turn-helix transcriptional regulator n=1 Tax=Nostoc sp. 'Lobaria pulmonaria (5183) cyanobiont' TaxID=1618022 RepID=UPI000CF300BA|nr:AraC family transcriptional regulator [Nostoc sp. 'Lobaria pulmonaria (5183) cyanobiont']AVH69241.1 AraC family transcriptional regulator [Nostoc sp. 'Lobaria pulmonaria (5183) cyanobiont']